MQSRKKEEGMSRREKKIRKIRNFFSILKIPEELAKKTKL